MISFEVFRTMWDEVQDGILRDYDNDDAVPMCEVMHKELDMSATPVHDAHERSALAKANGVDIGADSIKLSEEHANLHDVLLGSIRSAMEHGLGGEQLVAAIFTIGRRYGMREAAQMMSGEFNAPE